MLDNVPVSSTHQSRAELNQQHPLPFPVPQRWPQQNLKMSISNQLVLQNYNACISVANKLVAYNFYLLNHWIYRPYCSHHSCPIYHSKHAFWRIHCGYANCQSPSRHEHLCVRSRWRWPVCAYDRHARRMQLQSHSWLDCGSSDIPGPMCPWTVPIVSCYPGTHIDRPTMCTADRTSRTNVPTADEWCKWLCGHRVPRISTNWCTGSTLNCPDRMWAHQRT